MSAVVEAREPSARYLAEAQPALVRQFELLATAPGGVGRLRELILTLAVKGRLVPQCPGEGPASAILARSRAAATEQRRGRRKSASTDIAPLEPSDGSPELPHGWEWCRGADLFSVVRGVTYQKADASDSQRDDYLPILRANNIQNTINFDDLVHVPAHLVNEEQLLRPGDFVVCLASGSKNLVGKAAKFTGGKVCSFGAFCGAIRLAVPLPFFSVYLASPLYRDAVSKASAGIGINNLKRSTLLGLAIALPPEAEQARIVARVDELMRLCDALEAKGRLEAEQHARLLGTLLGALTDSSTPEELAANWQRVADHFDLLLDRPEAVDALEQTILQLAVRGLLVPRDSSDQAADLSASDHGAAMPWHWKRLRFGDVVSMLNGYAFKSEWFLSSGIRLVRNVNVSHGRLDWQQVACVSPTIADEFSQFALAEGDVVLSLDRPIISTGLKLAVVQGDDLPCFLLQRVARLSPDINVLSADYMLLWLRSDCFVKAIDPGRSNGVPHISTKQVAALTIDLPPLAEQARIVTRVTGLRRLCAHLHRRLAASQATQSHLAEALVDSAAA